jgi:hypothetical protein
MIDVNNALSSSFDSIEEAFSFMLEKSSNSREVTYDGFSNVINHLLPGRFEQK